MNELYQGIIDLISYLCDKKIINFSDVEKNVKKIVLFLNLENSINYNKTITFNKNYGKIDDIISVFSNYMVRNNRITIDRKEYFENELMSLFSRSHTEINDEFWKIYRNSDSSSALNYFYNYNCSINYIHLNDIAKNIYFVEKVGANELEITINMCKPEKDPKNIAALSFNHTSIKDGQNVIPNCELCKENEGYSDILRINKQNLRLIDLNLKEERWHFQFSPYSYFYQHAVVVSNEHKPMVINADTIYYLIDFVDIFPNYIIGSNADLPIVGGSILNHEHFQCGLHEFAIEKAKSVHSFKESSLIVSILDWPMTCIKIESCDKKSIIEKYRDILNKWKVYKNEKLNILPITGNINHNTLNPIIRKNGVKYTLYLILRNNRTNEEFPDGIFHIKKENQNIKKENIGLIEAMGLAILPGRLKKEIEAIKEYILNNQMINMKEIHVNWAKQLRAKYNNIDIEEYIKKGIALKFWNCLKDCCVLNASESKEFKEILKISTK